MISECKRQETFHHIIASVLDSSGYFGNATFRAIRRYLGKKVDGPSSQAKLHARSGLADDRAV